MLRNIGKMIRRHPRKIKLSALGVITSFVSVLIVDSSLIFFGLFYFIGMLLILSSAFIGIEKFSKNTMGELLSSVALVLIMLGVLAPLGFSPKFYYVQIAGAGLMLVGFFLKSPAKNDSTKKALKH
ncbi:Permease [Mesobacillus thioparans]